MPGCGRSNYASSTVYVSVCVIRRHRYHGHGGDNQCENQHDDCGIHVYRQYTVYGIRYTVYSIQYTVYSKQYQYTVYSIRYTEYIYDVHTINRYQWIHTSCSSR